MNFKKRIQGLEHCLKTSTSLAKVVDYFLTHLAEDERFIEQSVLIEQEHNLIVTIVEKIAETLFAYKAPVQHSLLNRFPASDLIHGTLVINHHLSNVIFFEQSGLGVYFIPLLDGQTHFFRFSATSYQGPGALPHYGNVFGSPSPE